MEWREGIHEQKMRWIRHRVRASTLGRTETCNVSSTLPKGLRFSEALKRGLFFVAATRGLRSGLAAARKDETPNHFRHD